MASLTIQAGPYFRAGDTLNAYLASAFPYPATDSPDGTAPPVGATATAVVASDGTVVFSGLADGTTYHVGTETVTAWTTGTAYVQRQPVTNGGHTYLAVDAHTAGLTFAGDLAAHWVLLPAGVSPYTYIKMTTSPTSLVESSAQYGPRPDGKPTAASPLNTTGAYWTPGQTDAPDHDTLFLMDVADEADATEQNVILSIDDYLQYFQNGRPRARLIDGRASRKAVGMSTGANDRPMFPVEGLLPVDQFTVEFWARSKGLDATAQTDWAGSWLLAAGSGGSGLEVTVTTTKIEAVLSFENIHAYDATLNIAAGDLPADTWVPIAIVFTGGQLKVLLGTTKSATANPSGLAGARTTGRWPLSVEPYLGGLYVNGRAPAEASGPFDVDGVRISRWARTINALTELPGPAITVDAGAASTTIPDSIVGVMAQYAGYSDNGADTSTTIRGQILDVVGSAGLGLKVCRVDHVLDQLGITGVYPNYVYDFSAIDDRMGAFHAAGFAFHITLDYTPGVLQPAGSMYDPPTDNAKFAKICSDVIAHFLAQGYEMRSLSLWNEPDLVWTGTKLQFTTLWGVVQAKLATDYAGNALVPGLDTNDGSGWSTTSFQAAVIDYAAANGRPLGRVWIHLYSGSIGQDRVAIEGARLYGVNAGFPNIEVGVGEWNDSLTLIQARTGHADSFARALDTFGRDERSAAYGHAWLCEALDAGVKEAIFFNLGVRDQVGGSPYLGMFNDHAPTRPLPAYAPFAAWAKLAGKTRVSATSNWPSVRAVAGKSGGGVIAVAYGNYRWWRAPSRLGRLNDVEITLSWSGLPATFKWKHWRADRSTMPEGRLVLVAEGDQTNLPTSAKTSHNGIGVIEVTP